jgi:hypothetical protein
MLYFQDAHYNVKIRNAIHDVRDECVYRCHKFIVEAPQISKVTKNLPSRASPYTVGKVAAPEISNDSSTAYYRNNPTSAPVIIPSATSADAPR